MIRNRVAFMFFPTTTEEIVERLSQIDPKKYDQSRNNLIGAVTGLSPYITHGFLTLPQIKIFLTQRYGLKECYRLIFELCWREFFQRYFWRYGEKNLWQAQNMPSVKVEQEKFFPEALLKGKTGVIALDSALKILKENGYIHNHSRMWFSAFLSHYVAVDWRLGAKYFWYYLLDGDLASNCLNWQWVNGTFSDKPYYFNQENINRHVPEELRQEEGELFDSYENLYQRFFVEHKHLMRSEMFLNLSLELDFRSILSELNSEEQILNEIKNCNELIYIHEWMINPWTIEELDKEGEKYRILVIDESFWKKYPAAAARFKLMVDLAKNIPNIRIYLGDPVDLFKKAGRLRSEGRGPLKVYSQEYFSDRIKSVFTSLYCALNLSFQVLPYPWLVPEVTSVPNRFSKFFKQVEKFLFSE